MIKFKVRVTKEVADKQRIMYISSYRLLSKTSSSKRAIVTAGEYI